MFNQVPALWEKDWLEVEVKIYSHWVEVRIASVTLCITFDVTTPNSHSEDLQIKMFFSKYYLTSYFFFTLNYGKTIESILKHIFKSLLAPSNFL